MGYKNFKINNHLYVQLTHKYKKIGNNDNQNSTVLWRCFARKAMHVLREIKSLHVTRKMFKKKQQKISLTRPSWKENKDGYRSHPISHPQSHFEHHAPQHFGQLGVCKTQCPQTEIRSSIWDATQTILNSMDSLCHKNLKRKELYLLSESVYFINGAFY